MKKIITILTLLPLLFASLNAKSYAEYMKELKGQARPKKEVKSTSDFSFFSTQRKYTKPVKPRYKEPTSTATLEKKFDKQIKEVKHEVKAVKNEVHIMSKAIESSNKDLINEVNAVKKEVKKGNSYQGKNVIPVATINETPTTTSKNSFLYVGFGYQGLSVADDNDYFGVNALDDSVIETKVGYGQYFDVEDTKLFATVGFEYMALKQADMKAITTSINTETTLDEDVTGYIGIKAGFSYLVWDIQQDEAVESITSSSPLVGLQGGIEYKFSKDISLVVGADYTKYFHETQIPNDTLHTDGAYGFNLSLKFYQ